MDDNLDFIEKDSASLEEYFRELQSDLLEGETEYDIHLQGTRSHYNHKRYWSVLLMCSIGSMILFQFILLTFIGIGWMDFKEYDWVLPTYFVQSLGQIIGLGVYAVRELFKDIRGSN